MYNDELRIKDRLEEILESIELIQEWSKGMTELHDFMISPGRVMAFNACVMRLQVIGEHVGRLMKEDSKPLDKYTEIPWHAIYGMRNIISHEYANIDETVVISAIKEDLPKLKDVVEELLRHYS
ncbi:MAG: DUF86 domain-containing protein [Prevotella sp.]|jgi:uncharacterized protein with HEPN domain|nr:DUF86 domain-containing protein [Prevotella sp.]